MKVEIFQEVKLFAILAKGVIKLDIKIELKIIIKEVLPQIINVIIMI